MDNLLRNAGGANPAKIQNSKIEGIFDYWGYDKECIDFLFWRASKCEMDLERISNMDKIPWDKMEVVSSAFYGAGDQDLEVLYQLLKKGYDVEQLKTFVYWFNHNVDIKPFFNLTYKDDLELTHVFAEVYNQLNPGRIHMHTRLENMGEKLELSVITAAGPHGDATYSYEVNTNRRCALWELLPVIREYNGDKAGSHGTITVKNIKTGEECYKTTYSADTFLPTDNLADELLNTNVLKVTGHGGYGKVNYYIYIYL